MEVSEAPCSKFWGAPPSMCGCIPSTPWETSPVSRSILAYGVCKHSTYGKHAELLNMSLVIIMEL